MKRRLQKRIWFIFICAVLFFALLTLVIYVTYKKHAVKLLSARFTVQGVDVSHYQGDIDWEIFAQQGVQFAYIKATEGSSHVDEYFSKNWEGAKEAGIISGAYHFFSFESPAETQAELYINTVGSLKARLVPAVDIEYYPRSKNHLEKEHVQAELKDLLCRLEAHYGAKPFIYSTRSFYKAYLKDDFSEYPLWLRNMYMMPSTSLRDKWMIWQYSDHAVLEGYSSKGTFIDKNAFRGTPAQLEQFVLD